MGPSINNVISVGGRGVAPKIIYYIHRMYLINRVGEVVVGNLQKCQWLTTGGGALCDEIGFTWTFPRNQDARVKLKSELISIKF